MKQSGLPNTSDRPVGYLRCKIYNRSILIKSLIDSGNMFGDLISEELATLLSLRITGQPKTVGTASSNGSVSILGKTKPFKIYLEGICEAVTIHPYVVRDLAHPMNLGQNFLRIYDADMSFRKKGIQLRIKGSTTMLDSSHTSLTKSTIDTRVKLLLDKFKSDGENPWSEQAEILDLRVNKVDENKDKTQDVPGVFYKDNKKAIEFSDTSTRVSNCEKSLLKAGHTTVVLMQRGRGGLPPPILHKQQNDVFLNPKKTNKWLNDKQIFVHPGTYHRDGNSVKVNVTNFGSEDKYLPKHCHVGNIVEAISHANNGVNTLDHRPTSHLTEDELLERRTYIIQQLKLDSNSMLNQNPKYKEEVIQIFLDGWDAISINEADYGLTDLMKFHIEVPKGITPARDRVRPLNPMQENDLRRQIDDWLEAEVIEPSNSPWASALVPCKKKGTDKYRWAIDYRKLNAMTVKDAFPLSHIETNLQKLAGTSIFSTLDSAGAFHTIPVHEEHRDYTAFNTPFGQYRFCRLPFGLANAPSAYSRLVQMALDRLPSGFALGYIDDIIVHSQQISDHVEHLRQVVMLHVNVGMKLNLQKCDIFKEEVQYLGHLVSADGIRMIPSYVQRIMEWPLPETGKELRSFLGFTGYYRSFIKEYAHLTHEMNKMKTGAKLEWTPPTQEKFQQLKECFQREPVRGYPQYENPEPFILDTDFSATNMAAVLSQKQDGKEVFLGCVAKKCSTAESSYAPHKGELAAVILGTKKFEHILRARQFVIRTDSRCVQFLHSMKEYRGIYARWNCYLNSFQFQLEHRAGTKQTNADALSRMPGLPEEEVVEDPTEYLHDIDDIYVIKPQAVPIITEEILKRQNESDDVISRIIKYVEEKKKPDKEERKTLGSIGMCYVNVFECLSVENGILKYQAPLLNGKTQAKRLCLPVKLYNLAFEMCHADSSGTSGHFGINNTFHKMKERFYFPHMYAQISARINNCVPCITKRTSLPKGQHQHHREQLSYFNQRVYCDVVGVLTGSPYHGRTCRYLLTIQDGFTRYLVAVPMPDQTTETIVTTLIDNWIYVFGCPETLHTDRGSSYTSNLFQEVMRALGIVKTVTPAYSPEGDRVERAHRVLGDLLRADRRYEAQRWTDKLKAALLAYNASVNRITGMSPFEAVFHRPVTLPVDIVFPFNKPEGQSWSTHVENLKLKLSQLCEVICKNQETGIMRDNARFQARSKPSFKEGDLCYYFLARVKPGLSKKLGSHWIGPWKVTKVISESLVTLYPSGNWSQNPREIAAIVNRLKRVEPFLAASTNRDTNRLDLDILAEDFDDGAEYLTYQEEFESVQPHPTILPPLTPSCPTTRDLVPEERIDENLTIDAEQDENPLISQEPRENLHNQQREDVSGSDMNHSDNMNVEPFNDSPTVNSENITPPPSISSEPQSSTPTTPTRPVREAAELARTRILFQNLSSRKPRKKREK